MEYFVLIPKTDYDAFSTAEKNELLNISSSYHFQDIIEVTLSGVVYKLFEITHYELYSITKAFAYRILTKTTIKDIISSGIYDPTT